MCCAWQPVPSAPGLGWLWEGVEVGMGGGFGEDRFRGGHVGHWVHLLDLWNIKELGKMEIFNKFF